MWFPPNSSLQARMDLALNSRFENDATQVVEALVPGGTTVYIGYAASQDTGLGGTLLGGGNQVFIPQVDPAWIRQP